MNAGHGTTYPCIEYGVVQVPITEIVVGGTAEIFPEVTNRGFFDIDFRDGKLVLTAKNYIGLIPINERVSIHVSPRFPIKNVLYLVQKAQASIRFLPGYNRSYKVEPLTAGNPEELFTVTFAAMSVGC